MTKTSIFGQSEVKQEEKKQIEFVKYLSRVDGTLGVKPCSPDDYENVTLLQKNYTTEFDLMWAYDDDPNEGYIYLGHWNDGIV